MSWFKKIFGSQYEFNSQSSSQSSSQEPKVRYVKEKSETDGNNTEIENLSIEENQECDETTQSTQDSRYSWSGVSQEIDIKGEKRELSDEEDEPWWESFKSQSTQKLTQESSQLKLFSSSQPSNLQPKAEASSSRDDNISDKEEEKDEDNKISFYLKLGKCKKFKYM